MEKEDDYTVSFCPSFRCYTGGDQIAETAERVRQEYSDESNDEFEFSNLREDCEFVFPVFNQILITNSSAVKSSQPPEMVTTQLRDFFVDDSSEIEEISSEMYCLWSPEIGSLASSSSSSRSSSSSTSTSTSSRRWRIRDLLKKMVKKDEAKKKKKEKEKINAMKEEEKRKLYLPYRQKNYYSFLMSL
ncbi:hypothetical protein V5N11_012195 [Cardamine amara subsp. amara]|uniref:Uncharacterized protein n=1 Tax=Cardamine amara subsp. amara TaxID=228776 RepID=A0ABD1B6G4_CARAN